MRAFNVKEPGTQAVWNAGMFGIDLILWHHFQAHIKFLETQFAQNHIIM